MITIITDDKREKIGKKLFAYYEKTGRMATMLSASGRDIKPCYGCDGCLYKTLGKCVVRDDMDEFISAISKSDMLIFTSPLMWGGFSYDVKKVIDKIAIIGNRFYHVRDSEIVKGMMSDLKKVAGIAVSSHTSQNQAFAGLIREMGIIMDVKYISRIVDEAITGENIESIAREVISL